MRFIWAALLLLAGALVFSAPAHAQAAQSAAPVPTPEQIQGMINAGQETQAVQALQNVLAAHPKSAVGWYLLAEAYDAQNNEANAADALNMAERISPGLSFANPQEAAALKAHINQSPAGAGGGHMTLYFIIGAVLLLIVLRFLPGRGVAQRNYGYVAPPPPPGTPPYGFGYGQGTGAGLGSAILGGIAAGTGFAIGERVIDNMMGPQNGGPMIDPNITQGPDPARDDGLMGNPGWDGTGTPSDDDLSNTGWS